MKVIGNEQMKANFTARNAILPPEIYINIV